MAELLTIVKDNKEVASQDVDAEEGKEELRTRVNRMIESSQVHKSVTHSHFTYLDETRDRTYSSVRTNGEVWNRKQNVDSSWNNRLSKERRLKSSIREYKIGCRGEQTLMKERSIG